MSLSLNPPRLPDDGSYISFMVHSGSPDSWDPACLHTMYWAANVTGGPWGCPTRYADTPEFAALQAQLWAALPLIPATACHACRKWKDGPKVPRMNAYQGENKRIVPRSIYGGEWPTP